MTSCETLVSAETLVDWGKDARQRTLDLIADLSDQNLIVPHMGIINPLLWEIGHVAWFQEKWILRHVAGQKPLRPDADSLYDSIAVTHDTRWDLLLPSRTETLDYVIRVRDNVLDLLDNGALEEKLAYFVQLTVFHEDMHTEAFTYTRQTLGYPPPPFTTQSEAPQPRTHRLADRQAVRGDAEIPGGPCTLGARRDGSFVFDNEKWAHPVDVRPFAISRVAVTQAQFAAFVDDQGYSRKELWSHAGWSWRQSTGAEHPVSWHRDEYGNWCRRDFDRWIKLEEHRPVIHVNWYEAEAYCRWARRRLPAEVEWERAASLCPEQQAEDWSDRKRRFPWGDEDPTPDKANLDWRAMGTLDVDALPCGDSALGCRQMIGNVWEWTADWFRPYPGFVPDPYREYSQPWFGSHKVLRGGCWCTRRRLIRNSWRNFYRPDRRDVWAGFRTCALND